MVIFAHISEIPAVFLLIFKKAFSPTAAAGGFLGAGVKLAIQHGFRRGLLTNEAGLGKCSDRPCGRTDPFPVHQGLIGVGEVFIDTIVVCTITALINLSTGMWQSGLDGTAMTAASFSKSVPLVGGLVVAFSSLLFGYSTLIGWYYYGEQCMRYLFGIKSDLPYRVIFVALVFAGSVISLKLAFYIGDIANALMAFPNLIGLALMSGTIGVTTREFFNKYKKLSDFKE